MFSRKLKRAKIKVKAARPSGSFPLVPLTHDHCAILSKINSPWFSPLDPSNRGIPGEEVLRNALKSVTEAQVAEFVFVRSRPAAESRAVLARGRTIFTEIATDHLLKWICRADLEKIIANGMIALAGTIRTPQARSRSNLG
jgi:hypothetical protein